MNIYSTKSTSLTNDHNSHHIRHAEEYIMTSAAIHGIKRSNVCGDGYRIDGAVVRSYPYSIGETYLPYENCFMTFQARRPNDRIRIHIVKLDLNDIQGGTICLDSLRFYQSVYIARQHKLNSIDCGQINEAEKFSFVSPTGNVTIHFSTDGGHVNGLGFKVILTAFRIPDKTHPCDHFDDEFLCGNGDCISSSLLCDGVTHCLDGSDESSHAHCTSNRNQSKPNFDPELKRRALMAKHQHWRGILIIAFLLIIFSVFVVFLIYFVCRYCMDSTITFDEESSTNDRKSYSSAVQSPLHGRRTSPIVHVIKPNEKNRKSLNDDYNVI